MESGILSNKLKIMFEKILEPGYVINNYYADSLINKFKSNDPEILKLFQSPLLTELILSSLPHIEVVNISVKVFLIRLMAIVSQNELRFTKVFNICGDTISKAFKTITTSDTPPNVRVAYIELASTLVSHNSGVAWIMRSESWKQIFGLCYEKQTVFVYRQVYKFTAIFLWKLSDFGDETGLIGVLDFILKPITKNPYHNVDSLSKEDEVKLTSEMEPALHMVMSILNERAQIRQPNILIKLLVKHYSLNYHLFAILSITHREDIMLLLAKLVFLLIFAKIFLDKPMTNYEYERSDFLELSVTYFNILQLFIKRRLVVPVLDFCNVCNIVWSETWGKTSPTIEIYGRTIELQRQLIFIPLVPLLVYIKQNVHGYDRNQECIQNYIIKLLNSSCEHTARAAYSMRDLMYESDPLSVTLQSVKRLFCLKNHLNNSQANLIFQALFYILKDFTPLDDKGEMVQEEYLTDSSDKVLVMTFVIDAILMLVKDHEITWHESFEVLCLYNQVYDILKRKDLPCKFIVTALNLIALTVKKFLPPNLTLLLDSKPGSSIHEIGKLIYSKMHDPNWEIRDSALELLHVCTEISFIKYAPFQKQITENNLIVVAATIAISDNEFYVQASALKCLGSATKIQSIWEDLTQHHPDIHNKLISLLEHNQEGIVRKEIVAVLTEAYQNLKLQQNFKELLYQQILSAAIDDFHWEVQLAALKFWKIVVQTQLANQGMLDGKFPPVTFSKENRKIVTLNDSEIQRRLAKMLQDLSSIGCLSALLLLLQDDIDVEIMESSLSISKQLLNILLQYKVRDVLIDKEDQNFTEPGGIEEVKLETEMECQADFDESDVIIEDILNVDDINLLANIYNSHMKLQNNQKQNGESKIKKPHNFVSPSMFVDSLCKVDYKSIIDEKKKWKEGIRNLSSLLDDILGLYECSNEVNDLDCY